MRDFMRGLEVRMRYVIWAYQRLSYPTANDKINYQGSLGYAINGVNSPMWKTDLSDNQINENSFLVVRSLKRDLRVFKNHYNFQMGYWYSIDKSKPLNKRISYKNSSNISF